MAPQRHDREELDMTNVSAHIARTLFATLVAALMAASALAQDTTVDVAPQLPSSVDPQQPVIQLGPDETVTQQQFALEFDRAMRAFALQAGMPYTAETRELFDRFRGEFLDQYATQQALLREAETRGITVTDEEIDQEIERARTAIGADRFDETLRELGYMTEDAYRGAVREGLVAQRVADEYRAEISPTDEEIQGYYDQNRTTLFQDRPLDEVRPDVENRFVGERLNERFRQLRDEQGIQTFPERVQTPAPAPAN
jgi:parvulin-like peptidyl-prolyl isomerase